MKADFTIAVFSADKAGVLHRVTTGFTKRHINIESLTVCKCEVPGISRYTIVVHLEEDKVRKLCASLEKQIDVYVVIYYPAEQIVAQELALIKVATKDLGVKPDQRVIMNHHARVIAIESDYMIVEKVGTSEQIEALYQDLEQYGILEFVQSGRVAIAKPMKQLQHILDELKQASAPNLGLPSTPQLQECNLR